MSGPASRATSQSPSASSGRSAHLTISIPCGGDDLGCLDCRQVEHHARVATDLLVAAGRRPGDAALVVLGDRRLRARSRRARPPSARAPRGSRRRFRVRGAPARRAPLRSLGAAACASLSARSPRRQRRRSPRASSQTMAPACRFQSMNPATPPRLFARHRRARRRRSAARARPRRSPGSPGTQATMRTTTYGGDLVSTWSVLRQSCKPRSPVGLVNPPGNEQMRRMISHSLPR